MKKVISFSLWGNEPKYNVGAIRNVELAPKIYPGWEIWFYTGRSVPKQTLDSLQELGARIISMNETGDWTSMFWRFLPAGDPCVDVMISRDCDSRFCLRESAAVKEWLNSDKRFHIMRDHPSHSSVIMGGMWGVKKGLLHNLEQLINDWKKYDARQTDQDFLRQKIYPLVRKEAMVHDEFFELRPFPLGRQSNEFVGEVIDEFDNWGIEGRKLLDQKPEHPIQYNIANIWKVGYQSFAAKIMYRISQFA